MKAKKSLQLEIKKIAQLANLPIRSEEIPKLKEELKETLNHIKVINEKNTQNILPTFQISGLSNISRKDAVKPGLTQKEALSNCRDKKNGFFVFKKN